MINAIIQISSDHMGIYLNLSKIAFQRMVDSDIYVDHSFVD